MYCLGRYSKNESSVGLILLGTVPVHPFTTMSRKWTWRRSKTQSTKITCPAGTGTLSSAAEEGNAKPAKPKKLELLRPCTWNVRTLLAPGPQSVLAETLRAQSTDIACLQETRIPDGGHTILSARNPAAQDTLIPLYKLLYSCTTNNTGHQGVDTAASMKLQAHIFLWLPVTPRICANQLGTKLCRTTIICAYAATEDACREHKDDFYATLRQSIEKVGRNTIVFIRGEFNAKVGQPTDSENCLGNFSMGERYDNGQRLYTIASL